MENLMIIKLFQFNNYLTLLKVLLLKRTEFVDLFYQIQ